MYDDSAYIGPDMYNYQNYTNNGIPIGTAYAPNSDSIELSLDFKPTSRLRIGVGSSLMRHANVCESLSDEEAITFLSSEARTYATDGGILTHSMFSNPDDESGEHVESAWKSLNFLNQEHKMYVVQAKVDLDYTLLKNNFGSLTLNFCNVLQFTQNKGVDNQLYPGASISKNASAEAKKKAVSTAQEAWKKTLSNELSDYIFIGFTYKF